MSVYARSGWLEAIGGARCATEGGPEDTRTSSRESKHVLVVDDHPANLALIADQLALMGHTNVTAADAGRALSEIASRAPDVVLTDLNLPEMDGVSLAAALRQRSFGGRIVLMTASTLGHDTLKALAKTFDAILIKPIEFEDLAEAVAPATGMSRPWSTLLPESARERIWSIFYETTSSDLVKLEAAAREGDRMKMYQLIHSISGALRLVRYQDTANAWSYWEGRVNSDSMDVLRSAVDTLIMELQAILAPLGEVHGAAQ